MGSSTEAPPLYRKSPCGCLFYSAVTAPVDFVMCKHHRKVWNPRKHSFWEYCAEVMRILERAGV